MEKLAVGVWLFMNCFKNVDNGVKLRQNLMVISKHWHPLICKSTL